MALQRHRETLAKTNLAALFAADGQRFENFSIRIDGLLADYSKNRVTAETIALLLKLAKACDVEGWRDRMFAGDKINASEQRAVLHTALRRPATDSVMLDGEDAMPFIHKVLNDMKVFSDAVRGGAWKGFTGKQITSVIHIGIGGSVLGPQLVCEALGNERGKKIPVRFVSNIDGADMAGALESADPHSTLFIVASKTFTTQETIANAQTARQWLISHLKDEKAVARHFVALSTNEKAVADFGIAPEATFPFRDWVGGRYSLWSAIGLPVCLAFGFGTFRALLDGAHAMDRHFCEAPPERNIPLLLGLIGVWHRNFFGAQSYAVLPYSQNLERLPVWLQQVDMESNGKTVDRDGKPVTYDTGPVVFGGAGTNGQHTFYQLLHQGSSFIPCDFIGFAATPANVPGHHRMLLANLLAQPQALMAGRPLAESGNDPQRAFSGNRPSTTLLFERLDAWHLGLLLALYEHKIFVQGIIWNINSFDQWGVELGKVLANDILEKGKGGTPDASTAGLQSYLRAHAAGSI